MNVGEKIREIRIGKNIDQKTLAVMCGLSQPYLSQIEKGIKFPNINILEKISNYLNVPSAVLFYLSVEIGDVPDTKKEAFQMLNPTIISLIKSVFLS